MRWNAQDKKTLLINAIIWTLAAVAALLNVLHHHDGWWVIITILFAVNAAIRWSSYAKKRQEENKHE